MNNTIQRTFDVLDYVSKIQKGVTLQEIITEFNYPKSSAFVVVQSLLELGYLETVHDNDKKYCLGINTFQLGMRYVSDLDVLRQCSYLLNPLADKSGNTAFVVVLNGINVVYLDKYVPQNAVLTSCSLGARKKAYTTANGKALLAFLPEKEKDELVNRIYTKDEDAQKIISKEDLLKELDEIKNKGYSMKRQGEKSISLCFGAPIFDYTGHVIATISLSDVYDSECDGNELGRELKETALKISLSMGYKEK